MTNLEKTRQMSDEEIINKLVEFDCSHCPVLSNCLASKGSESCRSNLKNWFNSEVEE